MLYKFEGHFGEITAVRVRGDTVVSASVDLSVRVWSILAKEEVLMLDEYGYDVRARLCPRHSTCPPLPSSVFL